MAATVIVIIICLHCLMKWDPTNRYSAPNENNTCVCHRCDISAQIIQYVMGNLFSQGIYSVVTYFNMPIPYGNCCNFNYSRATSCLHQSVSNSHSSRRLVSGMFFYCPDIQQHIDIPLDGPKSKTNSQLFL